MDNIIINFSTNTEGLQPGIDGLEQIGAIDKANAEQAKATMDAYNKRDKAISDGVTKSTAQIDKLATSFKNLDKSVIGGAYTETLKKLQAELQSTESSFDLLSKAVEKAEAQLALLPQASAEFQELSASIKEAYGVLDAELIKAKEQDASYSASANANAMERIQKLAQEAEQIGLIAELKNTLSAKQASLVNATDMTVITQLNAQIQALEAEIKQLASVGKVGFDEMGAKITQTTTAINPFQRALSRSTDLSVIAGKVITSLTRQVVSLGVGMLSFVFGAKALEELGKVIEEVFDNLFNKQKVAAENQIKNNELLKAQLDYLKEIDGLLRKPYDERIRNLQNELKILQAGRTSREEILRKEQEITDAQAERGAFSKGVNGGEIDDLHTIYNELAKQQDKLKELKAEAENTRRQGGFFQGLFTYDRKKSDIEEDIKATQGVIDNFNKRKEAGEKANDEYLATQAAQRAKDAEIEKKHFEDHLKSITGYNAARLTNSLAESKAELNARLVVIAEEKRQLLLDPDIKSRPGEIEKIIADTNKKIDQARQDFQVKTLEGDKKFIQAQVDLQTEGTKEHLAANLALINKEEEIEIASLQKTANYDKAKTEIVNRYSKLRIDTIRNESAEIASIFLEEQIALTNTQLSQLQLQHAEATNFDLLQAKKKLVEQEGALEIVGLNKSHLIDSERLAQIEAVNQKILLSKQALEMEFAKSTIEANQTEIQSIYSAEAANIEHILALNKVGFQKRKELVAEYYSLSKAAIDADAVANQQLYDKDIISFDAYMQKKRELAKQYDDLELQQAQVAQQQKDELRDREFALASQLVSTLTDINQAQYDRDLTSVQSLYDKKLITEKEYNRRVAALKRAQALADRDAALFNIAITTAQNIVKDFHNPLLIAFDVAMGIAQAAAVVAKPIPNFKEGKIRIQGPGTETSDSIPARLSKNESVIKASMSKKHEDVLRAINEDRFHQFLQTSYKLPEMQPVPMPAYYQHLTLPRLPEFSQTVMNSSKLEIDYEKLAEAIAMKTPQTQIHMDENGLSLSILKNGDRITYVNKKLNL